MKVYMDLIFMMNVSMDFLLLCTVGRVLHLRMKPFPLVFSSVIGGIYACFAVFLSHIAALATAFFFAPILLIAAFGKSVLTSTKVFSKAVFMLFGASFLSGGIYVFLSICIPKFLSPLVFFPLCCGIFFFTFRYFDLLALSRSLCPVTVTFSLGEKTETVHMLCDSGNLVREPISALPVLLLSPKKFDALFPNAVLHNAETALQYHLRYVPIQTVSGSGVIPAVMPNLLSYRKKNEDDTVFCAMLGRAQTDSFSGYDGIFPASLL